MMEGSIFQGGSMLVSSFKFFLEGLSPVISPHQRGLQSMYL